MIAALVLALLAALSGLLLPRLLRPVRPLPPPGAAPPDGTGGGYPESMTAELDPWDEEYLAWLADDLWPDDEYLEPEHSPDGEGEAGGSMRR